MRFIVLLLAAVQRTSVNRVRRGIVHWYIDRCRAEGQHILLVDSRDGGAAANRAAFRVFSCFSWERGYKRRIPKRGDSQGLRYLSGSMPGGNEHDALALVWLAYPGGGVGHSGRLGPQRLRRR